MNILIYLCILIICLLSLYFFKLFLSNFGLIITMITMNLISLILSFKFVTLSTINLNANTICYITMFTSLYLLIETMKKEEVKKIINLNFFITVFASIFLFLMSYHTESITDSISINMKNVFITNYRILITYPISTLLSNYLLVALYKKIKSLYDLPFITTVTTYLVIGLVSNLTFYLGAYLNIFNIKTILESSLSTYMIGLIITVIYSLILPKYKSKKVVKWYL